MELPVKENFKLMPPAKKKIACKVLKQLGFSYRQITEITGVPTTTAYTYSKEEIPPELERFGTELENAFKDFEVILAAKAAVRIEKCLPQAKIRDALDTYGLMMGKKQNNPVVAVQTNLNVQEGGIINGEQLSSKIINLVERIETIAKGGNSAGSGPDKSAIDGPGN